MKKIIFFIVFISILAGQCFCASVTTQAPIFSPDIANTTGSITCTGGVYFHGILVKNGSVSTNWGTVTLGTMSFIIILPGGDSLFVPLPYPYYVASGSIAYSSNTANLNVQVLYTK